MMKRKNKWKLIAALLVAGTLGIAMAGCSSGKTPVEAWKLDDGGADTAVSSELKKGTPGVNKWGVYLNNATFGKVLDFSTKGSNVFVKDSKAKFSRDFSVSAWIKAPVREQEDRVILMQGKPTEGKVKLDGIRIFLDGENNMELNFEASGVTGVQSSGVSLADGLWHHILVSIDGGTLNYHIDGELVKSVSVSGKVDSDVGSLFIGSDTAGECGFDGSIAEVRIFKGAVSPDAATDTKLDESDNEAKQPRLNIKHGIALDRRQYSQPEPLPNEGQTVTEDDIVNCINMGFDHCKLLLTPNHLINEDGSLKTENMEYITRVVDYVAAHDYRCILCIHPEDSFKMIYLKNLDNFETLCKWYGELAAYIGEHWDADTVALQLMTEPGENNMTVSWSWMSDRMWGAVRNVLPDHTILTSSDRYGNLEQLKYMSPATDDNLIYTFTTYEPYTIGWYYYNTAYGQMTAWSYVHDIPYPVEEGVDYTEAIENAIDQVPETLKNEIRDQLWAYVRGEYDGKRTDMPNNYDSLYNAEWHMLRAKSLDDWRQKYGGNIHIMCVEFGCMDAATPAMLWHSAAECYGITDENRIEFTRDMRSAFDAYDIGWDYWSYNEAHTVFKPASHAYGASPMPDVAVNMFDYDMLKEGLGLTPLVSPNSENDVPEDPDWLVLNVFEGTGGWYGSDLEVRYDGAPSGYAYVAATTQDASGASVFACNYETPIDISSYENGYAHLWVYVEDASLLAGGQIELCSGGGPDMYETGWNLSKYISKNGWNELYLPFSEAVYGSKPCDLTAFNYVRLYTILNGEGRVALDHFYFCHEKPEGADENAPVEGDEYVITTMKDVGGWYGSNLVKKSGAQDGGDYVSALDRDAAGSAVYATGFPTLNLSNFADGKLHLWIYIEDVTKLTGGQIELTSSGAPDAEETSWNIVPADLKNGWNELTLSFAEANAVGGGCDLSKACYMRIFLILTDATENGLGEIKVIK